MFEGYSRIVVLTGAGISHSAGLPTYRGPGGLWADPRLAELSQLESLTGRREEVCDLFWSFHQAITRVEPTPAHRALAAFEQRLPAGASMLIVTQNVDGLHQRAGSIGVTEYHGSLARWRCERCKVELEPPSPRRAGRGVCDEAQCEPDIYDADPAAPSHCGERMRPAVVLFGEMIPVAAEHAAKVALRECDLFVAIGTSGSVAPASSFVRWAQLNNARRVLLNLEIFDGARDVFTECVAGPADELVPGYFT
jgi:NAD-dependent deacetylase